MPRYKKPDKKIYMRRRILAIILLILIIFGICKIITLLNKLLNKEIKASPDTSNNIISENTLNLQDNNINNETTVLVSAKTIEDEIDWRIRLANTDNILPEDFSVELADIDSIRQFDARAIDDLNEMMNDMRKDGITNVWVQSAYRSIEKQKTLYNNSIDKYIKKRKDERTSRRVDFKINK